VPVPAPRASQRRPCAKKRVAARLAAEPRLAVGPYQAHGVGGGGVAGCVRIVGMADVLSPAERKFWHEFDRAAATAGNPSAGEISRLASEIIGYCLAESTIRGWLAHRCLPRDEEGFLAVIKVFQAEQRPDWLPLLHSAQKGRNARLGSEPGPQIVAAPQAVEAEPSAAEIRPSVDERQHPQRVEDVLRKGTRRVFALVGGGVLVAALAVAGTLALSAGGNRNNRSTSPESDTRICADVISPVAHVFPQPGAEPYDKIAKYHGDQIVLHPAVSDATDSDGRQYRAIRSPARADPGKFPYSWMLAEDITGRPCRR
jgi:hypothetical protein